MKRIWMGLLALAILMMPLYALAEAAQPEEAFEDAGDIDSPELWIVPEDGGLTWDASRINIALPEDPSTGYAWSVELDNETVLSLESDALGEARDGALPLRTYAFKPAADGAALIVLYYEQPDGEEAAAMLNYSVTVEGGAVTDVQYEDLSDWGQGDDEGGVLYEGETGGVPLYLPESMTTASEEDGVIRLVSEDGSIIVTIEYDPDGDAEEMLAEFDDQAAMEQQYNDETTSTSLISAAADRDNDPPRGIAVYETSLDGQDSVVEYTAYEAPNGGVLHVHTSYIVQ